MVDILDLVEAGCRGTGTATFISDDPNPKPIADIWRAGDHAAGWVNAKFGDGAVVAGVLSNTLASIGCLLGTWRTGATFASLPLPGRSSSPEEYVEALMRICKAVDADVLMIDQAYMAFLPEIPIEAVSFEDVLTAGFTCTQANTPGGSLVQFTSGSTSEPKGIRLTLDAIGANVTSILERIEVEQGDMMCTWLPLSHDMGLIGMCLAGITGGAPDISNGSFIMIKPEQFINNPSIWLKMCSEIKATITAAPNFALELAARRIRAPGSLDLSPVRVLITGAEPVRAKTLRGFEEAYAQSGFRGISFCPAYGMAEATLAISLERPDTPWSTRFVDPAALANGRWTEVADATGNEVVACGRVVAGMGFRTGQSDGTVGEIEVTGPSMLSEYVGAELHLTDDGWFPTSDLGYSVDGELFVLGRTDDMIILQGLNFYASDLEAAVSHPSIKSGAVVAVPTDDGKLAIVVEPAVGTTASDMPQAARDVRREVAQHVGVSPAAVVFVAPRSLPKTSSGKLQRFKVRLGLQNGTLDVQSREDFGSR